jgi:hypothetical protein
MPLAVTSKNILNELSFIFAVSVDCFLNNLQRTMLTMEYECVLCEVGTEILYMVQMKIIFSRIKRLVLYIVCVDASLST